MARRTTSARRACSPNSTTPHNATNTIVEEMLKQGSQLKPSLYKNQGEIIKIFVARDVDFSTVYELRPAAATELRHRRWALLTSTSRSWRICEPSKAGWPIRA